MSQYTFYKIQHNSNSLKYFESYARSYSANVASLWAGRWTTWEITVSRYFSHGRCHTILHHITYSTLKGSWSVVNPSESPSFSFSMNDSLRHLFFIRSPGNNAIAGDLRRMTSYDRMPPFLMKAMKVNFSQTGKWCSPCTFPAEKLCALR